MSGKQFTMGEFLSECYRRGRAALSSSVTVQWARRVARGTTTAAEESRVANAVQWSERVARTSWSYRWLTAEPKADVVVIDLRETVTVGLVLLVLERVVGPVAEYWGESRASAVAARFSEQFAARPVSVGSAVALVAILVNLCLLVVFGTPSSRGIGTSLIAASLALAGTRVMVSADELTETDVYALVVTVLVPPDPPEDPPVE